MVNVTGKIDTILEMLKHRGFEWSAIRDEVEEYILENYGKIKVHGVISVEKEELDNDWETSDNLFRVKDERGLLFEIRIRSTWDEFKLMSLSIDEFPY